MTKKCIRFFYVDTHCRIREKGKLRHSIQRIVREEGCEHSELNIILCSDRFLLGLNRKFLRKSVLTDILAFDFSGKEGIITGELYISSERVAENAKIYRTRFGTELSRVIYHGILHLTGYKDKTISERKKMRNREEYYLKKYP